MANMSYCAFRNTLGDLCDCEIMIEDAQGLGMSFSEFLESLSCDEERRAVRLLLQKCNDIINLVDDMGANDPT